MVQSTKKCESSKKRSKTCWPGRRCTSSCVCRRKKHCRLRSNRSRCRRRDRSSQASTDVKIENLKTNHVHSETRVGERTDGSKHSPESTQSNETMAYRLHDCRDRQYGSAVLDHQPGKNLEGFSSKPSQEGG